MIHTSAPHVLVLSTDGLGDRSYLVHDGRFAVAIDPQRDYDRFEHLAAEHGITITHVLETHIHNDYVSGGLELARRHQAQYVIPGTDGVAYEHLAVTDGDSFMVGSMTVSVTATPGHTPNHIAFTVTRDGHPGAVFTGGSMLYGAVGRPDLVQPELTEGLAHDQWHSVQRLARELSEHTHVYPTHGFGSFCAATQNEGTSGTIADELQHNPALTQDERPFVEEMLAALDVFPAYYVHMGPANVEGAQPIDLSLPAPADPAELRRRIDDGEWVVDLRSREVFATGHVRGTLSFDLDGAFVTYLGWLIPWGTPLTLLGDTTEQIEAAQRELVRIGIDRPVAQAVGDPAYWAERPTDISTHDRVDFAGLLKIVESEPDSYLLDVRQHLEYTEGHLVGAHHVPFYQLPDVMADLPRNRRMYVYCGSGYRAAAAISLLKRAGFDDVVHVDDNWENAAEAGHVIESTGAQEKQIGWTWTESRATARRHVAPAAVKASA
jgi:hydroxyacylglutathione hydrolase